MTAPAPAIRLTGIRKSIPPGYTLGRITAGIGDVQLIRHDDLAVKLAQTGQVLSPTTQQWQAGNVSALDSTELVINSTTITLANRGASTLMGNPGTAAAKPSDITIGTGLALSTAGTLSNSGIISLVGGSGITISNGNTIVNAGIISLVAGTNVTITNGNTISATGGGGGSGTVTEVDTGAGLSGGPITTSGTIVADWNGGTVVAVGPEFVKPSGTLHFDQMPTYISASATVDTTYFGKNLVDNSTGTADVVLTLPTLTAGTHLTFAVQNNSAHHYVRVRPATGVTINGVPTSDYLLPNFTGGEVAIDSTGTAYTTGAALSFWNPSAGYVTALNGLTISNNGTFSTNGTLQPVVDGVGIILSGGTISATGTATLGAQYSAPSFWGTGGVNAVANATGGMLLTFQNTDTIYNAYFALNSLVNGGSYIAQICPLNASNVVQAVNTSATVVASGTLGAFLKFSFGSGVAVSAATTYSISCSRLDGGSTFVLPLRFSGLNVLGFMKNVNVFGNSTSTGIFQNAVTAISNGITLGGTNTGYYWFGVEKTF